MEAVTRRFDRFSTHYAALNGIQETIALELTKAIVSAPKRIADLGCGEGAIYRRISRDFDVFVAIDGAPSMLALHPSGDRVHKMAIDFNDAAALSALAPFAPFDLIVSSCSLQWANDLDATLKAIAPFGSRIAFALFTSGTFGLLREISGAKTPLLGNDEAREIIARRFSARFWNENYRLEFASRRETFSYIRKSGAGGGAARLSVGETKRLIASYPENYLEYETLFAVSDF